MPQMPRGAPVSQLPSSAHRPVRLRTTQAFLASFDELARAVRRSRGARASSGSDSLSLSQYGLLEPLLEQSESRISDLARQAGISPPTASRILDTLERRKLVRRIATKDDRRAISVSLTGRGRMLLLAHSEWLRGRQAAFFSSLDPVEQAGAAELLVRLAALIDEIALGPPPKHP